MSDLAQAPPTPRARAIRLLWNTDDDEAPRQPFLHCVLDAAQDKRIFPALRQFAMTEAIASLYQERAAAELASVAPYLVSFGNDMRMFNWIWDHGWNRNWGIFFWSLRTADGLRSHLRTLTQVRTESRKILVFRFYDPRVLASVLPVLDAGQVREFFGPISRFMIPTDERGLEVLSHQDGRLIRTQHALS